MSPAVIRPLPGGTAVCALDGLDIPFPSWVEAAAECDAQHRPWQLDRFPSPPLDLAPRTT
ncbi:hypothetical protein [Actinoplanes rectilineatus]|uniref:hypothetical protein n=1 Tax=Actinoplanes rectilineatus TaxID=113571 RepID=UPI000AEB0597|nr:hypothetical protein [Actinoplanes rectilineatus]